VPLPQFAKAVRRSSARSAPALKKGAMTAADVEKVGTVTIATGIPRSPTATSSSRRMESRAIKAEFYRALANVIVDRPSPSNSSSMPRPARRRLQGRRRDLRNLLNLHPSARPSIR
jgi:hypothetical protein